MRNLWKGWGWGFYTYNPNFGFYYIFPKYHFLLFNYMLVIKTNHSD